MNPTKERFLLAATVLLFSGMLLAGDERAEIEDLVASYSELNQFSGSMLVAVDSEPIYRKGVGLANREWKVPNDPETKFRLGSITKQFTSMLILKMVEEGKIKLEDPLSDYLPWYRRGIGRKVTIHHLLTHTSGIPSYTNHPDFWSEDIRTCFTTRELIEKWCSDPLEFTPGSQWKYNNSAYVILGAIVEEITGKSYESVLRERILDPLGMADTGYDHYETIIPSRAIGYDLSLEGYQTSQFLDMTIPHAAGALYSTVDDLLIWDQSFYENKLISEDTKRLMETPFLNNYAYGVNVEDVMLADSSREVYRVSHGGGIFGFNTVLVRYPEEGYTIIVLCNQIPNRMYEMAGAVSRILFHQEYQPAKPEVLVAVRDTYEKKGLEAAIQFYRTVREQNSAGYHMEERQLNILGYHFLRQGKTDEAIAFFRLNVDAFPKSSNVYDSLGEAYLSKGDRANAVENYRKAIELDPKNDNAKRMIRRAKKLR